MNNTTPLKYIIVGGVAAGMTAALKIRRNDPRAKITVIQREESVSYSACGLPYLISGMVAQPQQLVARSFKFFQQHQVELHTAHEALYFDHKSKTVYARRLADGTTLSFLYDRLIIATGARARKLDIPGHDLNNVFSLRSLKDGIVLNSFIKEHKPKRAVIVGGGYIGLEMAEALSKRNIKVTVLEQGPQLFPSVDKEIAEKLLTELQLNDCSVYLNSALLQINGKHKVEEAVVQNAGIIKTDFILNASGVEANSSFAKTSGVSLGKTGAIAVNNKMMTNLHHVYAAGDCCEVKNIVSNKNVYLPLGTTANKQGRVAAENASGSFAQFKGVAGTSVAKVFNTTIARTGLSSKQAQQAGLNFKSVIINAADKAAFYSSSKKLSIKLIFKFPKGELLGAQIVGSEGAAKRIDVFATALQQKMRVYDIAELDLSYAPPYAPVWDPVLIAANQAIKILKESPKPFLK